MEKIREVMRWSTSCVQRSLSFDCFVTGQSFMLDTHTHSLKHSPAVEPGFVLQPKANGLRREPSGFTIA